jgi:hypothetical protein
MPLLDHFHAPLKEARHWEGFHARWASEMADALNEILPREDYFADSQIHVGSSVEIDVATFENQGTSEANDNGDSGGSGVATLTKQWAPPAALAAIPAVFPDTIEVQIISTRAGPTLVGAVEIVSPHNKDRVEARQSFAAKCAAYLQKGVGLVIVDIVTGRRANLHNDLVALLNGGEAFLFPSRSDLYATAYHPIVREKKDLIDWWAQPLAVGEELPIMPLAVRGLGILPLDLATTYSEARRARRI